MKLTIKPIAGPTFQVEVDSAGTVDSLVQKIAEASSWTSVDRCGQGHDEEASTQVDLPREQQRLVWNGKEIFAPSSADAGLKALAEHGVSEGDTVQMVSVVEEAGKEEKLPDYIDPVGLKISK